MSPFEPGEVPELPQSPLDAVVRSTVLSALPDVRIAELASHFTLRSLSPGALVWSGHGKDAETFVLASGVGRAFRQVDGARPTSTALLGVGELFGDVPGCEREGGEWLECLSSCELLRIPGSELRALLLEEPGLAVAMLARVNQRLNGAEHRLVASSRPVAARVAGTLLELAERFGVSGPGHVRVLMSLTHAQIANLSATRRETATKVLGSLREQGVAEVDRYEVRVLDQPSLLAVADGATWILRPSVDAA